MPYMSRAALRSARILAAACFDMGIDTVRPRPCGAVEARVDDQTFVLRWDVMSQRPYLVEIPALFMAQAQAQAQAGGLLQ